MDPCGAPALRIQAPGVFASFHDDDSPVQVHNKIAHTYPAGHVWAPVLFKGQVMTHSLCASSAFRLKLLTTPTNLFPTRSGSDRRYNHVV